jgi:serine/threonine-protein kinase
MKGLLEEAIACHKEAIRLNPDSAEAHNNLGAAQYCKDEVDEAIVSYKEAIRLQRDSAEAHSNLGNALRRKGALDEAIASCKEAIRLKPDAADAHWNLGYALRQKGEFTAALAALRRGHELGSRDPRWPHASAQWVRECERFVELDPKLPQFLAGNVQPANASECLALASMCVQYKQLPAAAARWFSEAFESEPRLADDLDAGHRYNAACAAALAGCGQGKDSAKVDDKDRARLRRQALDWLRADLTAWHKRLEKDPDKVRPLVVQRMQHWQRDVDFAGVRNEEALAKLPEAERQLWKELWQDVQALRDGAGKGR